MSTKDNVRQQAVNRLLSSLANIGEKAISELIGASCASNKSIREIAFEAAQEQINLFNNGLQLYDLDQREALGLQRDVTINDLSEAQAAAAILALRRMNWLKSAIEEKNEKRELDRRVGLTRQALHHLRKNAR